MKSKQNVFIAIFALLAAFLVWRFFCLRVEDYPFLDLWVRASHVIYIICWMVGMLYLPRLFVYHSAQTENKEVTAVFKLMEKRLLRFIMTPAMIMSWITGLWLAFRFYNFEGGWLHCKLMLVLLLSAFHGFLAMQTKKFAKDQNTISEKNWRILNEVPTIILILVVIIVIVKPF